MNMRQCDQCGVIKHQAARWFFVTDGKTEPSDWTFPAHWCEVCMEAAEEHLRELRS